MFFPSHRFFASLSRPGPSALAALYSLDSAARAITSTVLALHAYAIYKMTSPAQAGSLVSITYTCVSCFSLVATFAAPWIIQRWGVRRAYLVAIGIFLAGMAVLMTGTLLGLLGGMLGRALNGVLGSICVILFIVQIVPKGDLVRSETLRLFMSSVAWGAGPVVGVTLYGAFGIVGPALVAAAIHLCVVLYFRKVGFPDSRGGEMKPVVSPIQLVKRFTSQRQLRLAWLIVFGRSAWWSMFFTYPALYLSDHGLATTWAGWLAGTGNLLLAIAPLVRTVAAKVGLKKPIVGAFWLAGAATIGAVFVYDSPGLACLMILIGACFVVVLDSLGNVPFMRFARARERAQMTTVFRTYVDAAELAPSAIYALLLLFFDFRAVFVASGLLTILAGISATRLPRRL